MSWRLGRELLSWSSLCCLSSRIIERSSGGGARKRETRSPSLVMTIFLEIRLSSNRYTLVRARPRWREIVRAVSPLPCKIARYISPSCSVRPRDESLVMVLSIFSDIRLNCSRIMGYCKLLKGGDMIKISLEQLANTISWMEANHNPDQSRSIETTTDASRRLTRCFNLLEDPQRDELMKMAEESREK